MMIDMDGQPQLAEEPVASIPEENFQAADAATPEAGASADPPLDSRFGNFVDSGFGADGGIPHDGGSGFVEPEAQAPDFSRDSTVDGEGPQAVFAADNWFDEPLAKEAAAPMPTAAATFSEIADFGNQDLDAGALQFELTITEIDRADLRTAVLNAMGDPRLSLSPRELAQDIKGGVLVLPGLNAARCSLLVSRLQHVNVRLRWRQQLYEA